MFRRLLAFTLALTCWPAAHAADYCLALRGNGQLEPAHWGAVSNVVERLGLPRAMSGGSSASITMFLIDAIATNAVVKNAVGDEQRLNASLLVKSFEGFVNSLFATPQFRDFKLMYGQYQQLKQNTGSLEQLEALLDQAVAAGPAAAGTSLQANRELLMRNYRAAVQLGLLNPTTVDTVRGAVEAALKPSAESATSYEAARRARFMVNETLASIRALGAFDAAKDANLFFRPGVVDFNQFASQLGRIGDFYAAVSATAAENSQWSGFIRACAHAAQGKLWSELPAECSTRLNGLIATHFATEHDGFSSLDVGVTIPSFPTTAILIGNQVGDAQRQVADAFVAYSQKLDPNFGASFRLNNTEQVRFGYWGNDQTLDTIKRNLPAGDEKSRRFLGLGLAPWHEVLSLSPAEPGLAPLQFFSHGPETFVSAGGWSDLHPVLLLKASGCDNVVYVTRRGGESLFGQGVAKRLLNYDRSWSVLATTPDDVLKANTVLNNQGDSSDMNSLWSKLFNLANPQSSYKRALGTADAVLCTNWDSFELQTGLRDMIRDGYKAPFYVRLGSGLKEAKLSPLLDPSQMDPAGYPTYAGCY